MSDEFAKAADTTVEQDLKELDEINAGIAELIKRRHMVMDRARNKAGAIRERIMCQDEWYDNVVRGNPVAERTTGEERADPVFDRLRTGY